MIDSEPGLQIGPTGSPANEAHLVLYLLLQSLSSL